MPLAKLKDDVEIFYVYEELNQHKEPVIFVNGSVFNHRQWFSSYLPAFLSHTENQFSYVLYDYQGIGQSSPKETQFTLPDLADELLGLLEFLNIEKAHLFGVSKGTMVSQIFSALHPDRVLSIAGYGIVNLLGPKVEEQKTLFSERYNDLLTLSDIFSEKINSKNYRQIIRTIYAPAIFQKKYSHLNIREKIFSWFLERRVFPLLDGTPIRTLELLFRYYAQELENEHDYYASCINSIGNKPILLLNGTNDQVTPIELARDLVSRLENANLIEFDGFEHISPNIRKKQGEAIMLEYANFLSQMS